MLVAASARGSGRWALGRGMQQLLSGHPHGPLRSLGTKGQGISSGTPEDGTALPSVPLEALIQESQGLQAVGAPVLPPARRPRLEEHFYTTLLPDMQVLHYRHHSPHARLSWLERQPEWTAAASAPASLYSTYVEEVADLPTVRPGRACTSLLSMLYGSPVRPEPSARFRPKVPNPIDYTSIPKGTFPGTKLGSGRRPYSPLLSDQPFLHSITLQVYAKSSIGNKNILFSAIQSLTAISGVRAEPVFAKEGDNVQKIRAGMPIGASVRVTGPRMYDFLDKLVQAVLPRIREWEGIEPVVRKQGNVRFTLPETAIGYFPEIEPHFDMYPALFETSVTLHTHGRNEAETVACLSGFQLPFLPTRLRKVQSKGGETNAYKELGKLKTRAERVEAAKQIALAKRVAASS